ncbi:uncharacterized protein LOC107620442 [Arachis ipaensis]|uniref:uncharacterized protein LOC107620442 n=1 Tax=Arachis ipaensis TaxID=130454 RepID=UPI000A2B44C3|nr:uncharacterized protein LOC107620442 [Arachis ipaensis]
MIGDLQIPRLGKFLPLLVWAFLDKGLALNTPTPTPTTATSPHSILHSESLIFFHHPSDLFTAACKFCFRHRNEHRLLRLSYSRCKVIVNRHRGALLLAVASRLTLTANVSPHRHLCSTARAVELLPFVLQVLSFSAKFLDEAVKVFKARIMELALFSCLLRTIVF